MTKMLDRSRSFSTSIPPTKSGCHYTQDWIQYDGQGRPLPRDKQEHRDKQAAIVPPAVSDVDEDGTDEPAGPIDPDQPFFSLKKEINDQLGIEVRNRAEALAAIRKAGLDP